MKIAGRHVLLIFYTLSPYISLLIIAEALYRINGCVNENYSISRNQILLQITSAAAFSLSNTIVYFKVQHFYKTAYVRVSLDSLSLFILTLTLCKISDL